MVTTSIAGATLEDCAECARLLVSQLAEHGVEATQGRLTPLLQRVVADGRLGFLLVARKDSRMVGVAYAATLLSAEHGGFVSSLEELYVLPDFRGCGIGTALLTKVVDRAGEEGMTAIELEVEVGHGRAKALYARFGFGMLDRSRWLRKL